MAYTTDRLKSTRVSIALGDGATPEVFTALCGITTKGLQQTRATNDSTDWDCADPDAPPVTIRATGATDWSITGSGLLARNRLADLQEAFDNPNPVKWRFMFDEATGDTVVDGYYEGPALLTDLNVTGENGNYLQISLTITGADKLNFVPNT